MIGIILTILPLIDAAYIITLFGDVYKDAQFFIKTYPWIIDNIGGEISVDYYMQGSGRYSVPLMCALNELRMNTFLQAQYLKCEAEGNSSYKCLCEAGVDPQKYKHCVLTKGNYASLSALKYSLLGIDASPVIEIGYKNTIFGVEDSWYLKKVCTIFGDNPPRGCTKPFACNSTDFETDKRGVVNFNCPEYHRLDMNLKIDVDDHNIHPSEPTKDYEVTSPVTTTITTTNNDIYKYVHDNKMFQ